MKVLHVILSLRGGGAEHFAAQLIEHQISKGIDARACIFQRSAIDPSWCRNIPPPTELEYTPKQGLRGRFATRTLVKQLRTLVQQNRYDVIHTHLWPACNIVARATRRMEPRHVWHIHDVPHWLAGGSIAGYARRVQMRSMMRRCQPLLIACSRSASRATASGLRLQEEEIVTIRNGVDVEKFSPATTQPLTGRGPVRMIMTAAFRPLKGHSCLVAALEQLRATGMSFHVTFAGDTDSETGRSIRDMILRCGLSDAVEFAGHVDDVAAALRASDIFVLPSESEALGLSIVEAMACGLPVVATNVGGIPEVVVDGKTGFLVPPRDPIALASKLATLVESEELRMRMGALAAEKARSCHSFKDCAENVLCAYNSFVS